MEQRVLLLLGPTWSGRSYCWIGLGLGRGEGPSAALCLKSWDIRSLGLKRSRSFPHLPYPVLTGIDLQLEGLENSRKERCVDQIQSISNGDFDTSNNLTLVLSTISQLETHHSFNTSPFSHPVSSKTSFRSGNRKCLLVGSNWRRGKLGNGFRRFRPRRTQNECPLRVHTQSRSIIPEARH